MLAFVQTVNLVSTHGDMHKQRQTHARQLPPGPLSPPTGPTTSKQTTIRLSRWSERQNGRRSLFRRTTVVRSYRRNGGERCHSRSVCVTHSLRCSGHSSHTERAISFDRANTVGPFCPEEAALDRGGNAIGPLRVVCRFHMTAATAAAAVDRRVTTHSRPYLLQPLGALATVRLGRHQPRLKTS